MKTDNLIEALSRDAKAPGGNGWRVRLALVLLGGLVAAFVLVAFGLGVRPDIATAGAPVLLKALFCALVGATLLPLWVQLSKPGRLLGWRIGAVTVLLAACAIATVVSLLGAAPEQRMAAWTGGGIPWCLIAIPILSIPAAVLLTWFLRAFAPTRLALAGAAVGALSGSIGAMAYATYCPVDSVAFVLTWYVASIALCAAFGGLLGTRILRW